MKLKCVIFDFDGTLFDSMYLWDTVAESYVRSRGKVPKPTVREDCLLYTSDAADE